MAEHRVPIIAFVWRPEEMIPPVIQMAHRTGSSAIFDFSMMGVDALRSFLRKADPAGHVRDIKISIPALMDPSLGGLLKETGARNHATVIHACKCIEEEICGNPSFAEKIDHLKEGLLTS